MKTRIYAAPAVKHVKGLTYRVSLQSLHTVHVVSADQISHGMCLAAVSLLVVGFL